MDLFWMFGHKYSAKIWHYALPLGLLAVMMVVLPKAPDSLAGWALFVIAMILGAIVLPVTLVMGAQAGVYEQLARVSEDVLKMTPEQLEMLGNKIPHVRLRRVDGALKWFFEDTDVSLENFREFVNNSDTKEIFEMRATSGEQRRQWLEFVRWCEVNGYLIPNSESGNHSKLWYDGKYTLLRAVYRRVLLGDINNMGVPDAQMPAVKVKQ